MIYARFVIQEGCTRFNHKIIAKNAAAYEKYVKTIEAQEGTTIIDTFIDNEYCDIVVLPGDYKY